MLLTQLDQSLEQMFSKSKFQNSPIKFQNINLSENGLQYFNNIYLENRLTFNILAQLDDDTLARIPNDDISKFPSDESKSVKLPSLFQVFKIMMSSGEHNKKLYEDDNKGAGEMKGHNEIDNKDSVSQTIHLPENLNFETINRSYSMKALNDASKDVITQLDNFKYQKKSLKNDIEHIEEKIKQLQGLKARINNKIKVFEQTEICLKDTALAIKSRKDFVKEYGLMNKEDDGETDILNKYLAESKSFLEDYDVNTYEGTGSLPSSSITDSPSLPSMFIPEDTNEIMSNSEELSKFYDGPHRKQKYVSISLQNLYQPGSAVAEFKKAHADEIASLDFDFPFGTLVTAGCMDHSMKIWDLSGRKQIGTLVGHNASINCMQMDPNYNLVISGSKDATLKLWNIDFAMEQDKYLESKFDRDPCIYSFDAHQGEITALSLYSENLISTSRDKTMKQWDLKTGKCVQSLDVGYLKRTIIVKQNDYLSLEPPAVGALQCYETALATGTRDGIIRLWDLRIGKVVRVIEGHKDAISSLRFDANNLITGSLDKTARLWDLRTGSEVERFKYGSAVTNVHLDDQKLVVSTNAVSDIIDRSNAEHLGYIQLNEPSSSVTTSQYKNGYMIEGRSNGNVSVWSV